MIRLLLMIGKPRIRKEDGLWLCRGYCTYERFIVGYGYTPKGSYDEWQAEAGKWLQ